MVEETPVIQRDLAFLKAAGDGAERNEIRKSEIGMVIPVLYNARYADLERIIVEDRSPYYLIQGRSAEIFSCPALRKHYLKWLIQGCSGISGQPVIFENTKVLRLGNDDFPAIA